MGTNLRRGNLASCAIAIGAALATIAGSAQATTAPPTNTLQTSASATLAQNRTLHIIVFREPSLAKYQGETASLAAIPRRDGIIDSDSPEAIQYLAMLRATQTRHQQAIETLLGRPLSVTGSMQHASNAIIAALDPKEAVRVGELAEVTLVEAYAVEELMDDVGHRLIGAPQVWSFGTGVPRAALSGGMHWVTPANSAARGEGMVVGIIDTGINFQSPSFAERDPLSGILHSNPRAGFIGSCAPGGVDEGRCNSKLIGGWDFVCGPPTNACGVPGIIEQPGFGDDQGHGSHVAATTAGNQRVVNFRGNTITLSGVAPRANIIAYDACHGTGCPNTALVASVNQAIADRVHVINYSISGGAQPWTEAVSQAFLAAANAGIVVVAAAGNSGPGAGTLSNVQPWTTTVAAAQSGRGAFLNFMNVPGLVPADVALTLGTGGVAFTTSIPAGTPLRVSPGIDTVNDGCAAFPAGTFSGAIAVVRRGTCSFTIKANNATVAGAIAVVLANNVPGVTPLGFPGTSVPVFSITQASGNALRDHLVANPAATASIPVTATASANRADQLAAFSSRGPSLFAVSKPDITAPGVDVLDAMACPGITGCPDSVGLLSGTSMASPHVAGAAALMRQLFPSWTAAEIKSALKMTAAQTVLLEDGVTPAGPMAGGSGRVWVNNAARAGLVLNESTANFQAANPATGGSPQNLNLASLTNLNCGLTCSFTRVFRSTRSHHQQYSVSLEGIPGTVSLPSFVIGAFRIMPLTISINTAALTPFTTVHGTLVLRPVGVNPATPQAVLRLPISVRVVEIQLPPDAQTYTNTTPLPIPESPAGPAFSDIVVSGRSGTANGAQVSVNISHTWSGDLSLALIGPSGTVYMLRAQTGASGHNIFQTFTIGLANEPRNGLWRLRIQDHWSPDIGTLNHWSVRF